MGRLKEVCRILQQINSQLILPCDFQTFIMISNRTIEQVLNRANIVDVVSEYVHPLNKSGVNYKGLCPFHSDHNPSFIISPSKNICHCFVCGKGGTPVNFIMQEEGMTFPEAIRFLAKKYDIEVEEDKAQYTDEQIKERKKKEAMYIIYDAVAKFYREQIKTNTPKAKAALAYVNKRWNSRVETTEGHGKLKKIVKREDEDRDFTEIKEIGYAPDSWDTLVQFAKAKGYDLRLMEEAGLIQMSKRGNYIDFFRDRIMIPVTDRWGRVIAFTARTMVEEPGMMKYLNNKDSFMFHKGAEIFGLDIARTVALREGKVYCVEGAPDAMKLQSLGIDNTIAALGTAWTQEHFAKLKQLFGHTANATICWIPDSDQTPLNPIGPGFAAVMKNGRTAMENGFRVTVKEIKQKSKGVKADADSAITSKAALKEIEEEDFPVWYAEKVLEKDDNTTERTEKIKDVCSLVILVEDEYTQNALIEKLGNKYGGKNIWRSAQKQAIKDRERRKAEAISKRGDIDLLKNYGFYEEHNCCYSSKGDQWSNFTMKPLFHIKDPYNSKRIYKLVNVNHEEALVEMKEAEMNSLQNFRERVGSMGNFRWKAGPVELSALGDYLYDNTETATEIKQLGWNQSGFFVWGNGIFKDGKFMKVDDYGICRIDRYDDNGNIKGTDNYYLPAMSKIYTERKDMFKFERLFIFDENHSSISLPDYSRMMATVFGDNAKVGLMFLFATLFRDIVTSYTKNFPILNLFGPKGSGKSELGHTLMSFFIKNNTPLNIQNATIAALADAIAQCSDALVHIDEYKNNIDPVKIEFLKGLYDGTGRSRMNMDLDKKREITSVDSAVILSGQEMPTVDIALFSRTIYLTFDTTVHDREAKQRFNELAVIRKMGVSHLTNEILSHRTEFENEFYQTYNEVSSDIAAGLQSNEVEDRIWRDWSVLLATYKVLGEKLNMPWSYNEMKTITIDGIVRQNKECAASNEMGTFWDVFQYMKEIGYIYEGSDYKIKYIDSLSTNLIKDRKFPTTTAILMIRPKKIILQYKRAAKLTDSKAMNERSIRFYLQTSPGFLGSKYGAERFKIITDGVTKKKEIAAGKWIDIEQTDHPFCFYYDTLKDKFGLNLETTTEGVDDDDTPF